MGYFSGNENVVAAPNLEIYDAALWVLGLLESRMHMVWVKAVAGRLKMDFRYSARMVYN